jgi:hypothetical protein
MNWLTAGWPPVAINTSNGTSGLVAVSASFPIHWVHITAMFFQMGAFNDYPKLSVWPDGYYATFNMFGGNNVRVGVAA